MLSSANQADASLSKKWGSEIIHFGWTAIPNALLRNMGALDITPAEMVIVCYLIMFWWEKDGPRARDIQKNNKIADSQNRKTRKIKSI